MSGTTARSVSFTVDFIMHCVMPKPASNGRQSVPLHTSHKLHPASHKLQKSVCRADPGRTHRARTCPRVNNRRPLHAPCPTHERRTQQRSTATSRKRNRCDRRGSSQTVETRRRCPVARFDSGRGATRRGSDTRLGYRGWPPRRSRHSPAGGTKRRVSENMGSSVLPEVRRDFAQKRVAAMNED